LLRGNLAEQTDLLLQATFANQRFQPLPLRTLAGNQAFQVDPAIAQASARAYEDSMIFHGVESSHCYESETAARGSISRHRRFPWHIHAQPRNDHLFRTNREVLEDVAPVVLGDGDAKTAVFEFRFEIRVV